MATVLLSAANNILNGIWTWAITQAPYLRLRITPHRQHCLPVMAHMKPIASVWILIPLRHLLRC